MTAVADPVVEQIHHLPIDSVRPHPRNLNRDDVEDLVESIRQRGVLEPILVRSVDGGFEVIAGGRRLRAAGEAGLMLMPCIIRDDLDERAQVEVRAIENLARKDYHPLDEAAVYAELVALGATQGEIAELIGYPKGKGQPYISDRLALLRLPGEAVTAFRDGHLTVKQAEIVAGIVDAPKTLEKTIDLITGTLTGTLDEWKVKQLADEARHEKVETAVRADLDAKNIRVLTSDELEEDDGPDGFAFFELSGDGIDADLYEVGLTVEQHETEPCHAAHIGYRGEPDYYCTDPDRHRPSGTSVVKAPNLTDDRETAAENPDRKIDTAEAARDAKWKAEEAARRKERDAARKRFDTRVAAIRRMVTSNRSKSLALDDLVAQIIRDSIVASLDDEIIAALDLTLTSKSQSAKTDAILAYVAAGGDNIARFAMAVAFGMGESALERGVDCLTNQWGRYEPAHRAAAKTHLDLLVGLGYEPTDDELAAVAPPEEKPKTSTARSRKDVAETATDDAPVHSLDRGLCTGCGTDTALRKGGLYREHRTPDGAKCDLSGQAHEPPTAASSNGSEEPPAPGQAGTDSGIVEDEPSAPPASDLPTYKLTRARLEALRVLAFADAVGATGVVRSSYSTSKFEGDVKLVVLAYCASWLVDAGLATQPEGGDLVITAEGRRVALEEEVLAGIELPDPVTPAPAPSTTDAVDGDDLTLAWIDYCNEKAASGKKPSAGFETAKQTVIAALVDRHPDVFALTAGLAANRDGVRNGGDVSEAIADMLGLLAQGGPLPTEPQSLEALAKIGDELSFDAAPKKPASRVYIDELLAAAEARR